MQGAGADAFIIVKNDFTLDGVKINGYDAATGVFMIQLRYVFHVESKEDAAN